MELSCQLSGPVAPYFSHTIKQIHSRLIVEALEELTETLIASLEGQLYTAAEALSRLVMEQAVNLIYVAEDVEATRAKSLLKQHLEGSRRRALNWLKFAEDHGDESSIAAAKQKLLLVELLRNQNPQLLEQSGWPDTRRRFACVDLESHYHMLFASASDSVHALSEDFFNLSLAGCSKLPLPASSKSALQAEKASFGIYLGANALIFFCEAVLRLARLLGDDSTYASAQEIGAVLQQIIGTHEELNANLWGTFSPG